LREVGKYIGRAVPTVSRMESGHIPVRNPEVLAYLELCEVSDSKTKENLMTMCREAAAPGWWDEYEGDLDVSFLDVAWIEERASTAHFFLAASAPSLLQTPDYAEVLIREGGPALPPSRVDRLISFRIERQRVLERATPLRIEVIIDESALFRTIGDATITRVQLGHLRTMAGHPSVTLHVLPYSAGALAAAEPYLAIYEMPSPFPDAMSVDLHTGAVNAAEESAIHATYNCVRRGALSETDSAALLDEAVTRWG
jgi:hypothetical protein